MDDLIIKVIVRLVKVHESLGNRAYQAAAHQALVGIGRATMEEAQRQAKEGSGLNLILSDTVIRFPLDRTRQPEDFGDDA